MTTVCIISGLDVNALLRDMGRVLEFTNDKQAAATNSPHHAKKHYSAEESESIASLACGLLGFACKVGWVAVSELLLPVVTAVETSMTELVTDLENVADEGLTLLHHAVRSQNAALVCSDTDKATLLLSALSSASLLPELHSHPALIPGCGTGSLHWY